ncbi:hypothetical protein BGX26_011998 [Mortierella sp. AD094]|nr:hypothetical protein BGX26_011998 [Mortierella sp. AD094]
MATRSHLKQRFTPYRSTKPARTPDDLAVTFTHQCSLAAPKPPKPSRSLVEITSRYTKEDFWSKISDDALCSIGKQAISMNQSPDDLTESFTSQCSVTTSDSATSMAAPVHIVVVPSHSSVGKNGTRLPLIKEYWQLDGLSQDDIAIHCQNEISRRATTDLAVTIRSGKRHWEITPLLSRYVELQHTSAAILEWRMRRMESKRSEIAAKLEYSMATTRSHLKQRFTPYRSTKSSQTPDDLAATFTHKCSLSPAPKPSKPSKLSKLSEPPEDTVILYKKDDFWSRLSDDALYSIGKQASYYMKPSPDDIMESLEDRLSLNPSSNDLADSFTRQCSINSAKPAIMKNKTKTTRLPLIKQYRQLDGHSHGNILFQCREELLNRISDELHLMISLTSGKNSTEALDIISQRFLSHSRLHFLQEAMFALAIEYRCR